MTSLAAPVLRLRTADVNMHNESPTSLCAGLYRLRAVFLWTLGAEGVAIDASLRSVIKIFRCVLRDRCARAKRGSEYAQSRFDITYRWVSKSLGSAPFSLAKH
jgi:hypothetical protein